MKAVVAAAEMMMRLASSASESSLINDRESPRKWQSSAPPASCHDDRSWIILTLDKWNVNTAMQHHRGGAPIFAAPVTIGLISSIHHTREREGEIFELAENYWGKVSNDIMTPGLRGCHLTYLYIPGQCFFSRGSHYSGDPEPVQSRVITPYIFIIILDRDSGVRPS